MAIFGYTGSGTNDWTFGGRINGSFFTITENGIGVSIRACIRSTIPAYPVKAAIYRLSDLVRIAISSEVNPPIGTTWVTFPLTTSPSLISGIAYLLVVWSGHAGHFLRWYNSGITKNYQQQVIVYNGFPSPLVPTMFSNYTASIYCTYAVPTAHEVTISDSLGMLDGVTKKCIFTRTITESQGMTDSVTKQFDAKKTVTDKQGMLDSVVPKWDAHVTISDQQGMTDSIVRKKGIFQTIIDIMGLSDSVTNKGAFKQAVTDVLGMLDSAISKKRARPLFDLPDHTKRGGAPHG